MSKIIGGVCLLIAGIIILVLSIKEIKRDGIAGSIISTIIDTILGVFQFSVIGGVVLGLAFIIIGAVILF